MARIAMHDPKAQGLSGRFSRRRDALERRADNRGLTKPVAKSDILRERARKCDGIAVEPPYERDRNRHRGSAPAERGGDSERCDHVGGVGVSIKQPVAHCCPRHVADQLDSYALASREPEFMRKDRQRGVDEGQKPMRNVSRVILCLQGALRSSRSPRRSPQGGGWCASHVRVAACKMQVRRSRAFSSKSFWRGRSSRARPGRSSPRQVRVAVARMPRTAARPGR